LRVTTEPASGHADEAEDTRRGLERIIPDLIRRFIEAGFDRLSDGPDSVRRAVSELKLPREAITSILAQIDETKNGLYRVFAKEVRDFLGEKSFAEELTRALTALSFEIRTEVRFIPNDARGRPTPDVRSKVSVRRSSPPPAAAQTPPSEDPSTHPSGASSDVSEAHT
jgi:hypothetical protein